MLEVVPLEQAIDLVTQAFPASRAKITTVPLQEAAGKVIANSVVAEVGIPPFNRSTVDGFAVRASDTFGCSDALPAILMLTGEVDMGSEVRCTCEPGCCIRIPTGGQVPAGADAVVMLEYCEEFGDGTIGIARAVAPADNMVFAHDDVAPGATLIPAGTTLQAHHIGTLASLGIESCEVQQAPCVAVISTGDEIVPISQTPVASQMRDVNTPMLAAAVRACGAEAVCYPIVPDVFEELLATVQDALAMCDMVLVSGGSSAGQKDNTARVLSELGNMLFHGIAVKPGKPTMCAQVNDTPVFGLPGHPVAAYFMFLELVAPLLGTGGGVEVSIPARLAEGIPSNHGRSEFMPVRLVGEGAEVSAVPIRSKSGLISSLCNADGYIVIDRNTEGIAAGQIVSVALFNQPIINE